MRCALARGDVIETDGGPELLVSKRLAAGLYGIKGVEAIREVEVIGSGLRRDPAIAEPLFDVRICHSHVRVDFERSETKWLSPPDALHCRYCGPGGGGPGGCFWSFERIVLDLKEWDGEEIFHPINMPGTVVATERALEKAALTLLTDITVTPIENDRFSYSDWR
jgi:hypothetical protein